MANYSILVDVNLQTQQIKEQLNKIKGAKIDLDTSSVKQASKDIQDLELNFNSANEVFSKTIDIISSLASQVCLSELEAHHFLSQDRLSH